MHAKRNPLSNGVGVCCAFSENLITNIESGGTGAAKLTNQSLSINYLNIAFTLYLATGFIIFVLFSFVSISSLTSSCSNWKCLRFQSCSLWCDDGEECVLNQLCL